MRVALIVAACIGGFTLGCGAQTGVGTACETVEDCENGLICDVHGAIGTCQPADHGHDDEQLQTSLAGADDEHKHDDDEHKHDDAAARSANALAATAPSDHHQHGDEGGSSAHKHSPLDVSDWTAQPSIDADLTQDPLGGWNVRLTLKNFSIEPTSASLAARESEGHLHWYLDGASQGRLYGTWLHVPALSPGEHELRVELSANNHAPLALEGQLLEQTMHLEQATPDGAQHAHEHAALELATTKAPAIEVTAHEDPLNGWNLQVELENFDLAPELASTDHVDGKGHLHLYVNGEKRGRVYNHWIHVADDAHHVRLETSTNDHRTHSVNGSVVAAEIEL